jgi:hypothetical protein
MFFWVLYSLAVLFCAGFFTWNLLRYALPHRFRRKASVPAPDVDLHGLVPQIIALQAQFIVAPHIAIIEAQNRLEDRHAALQIDSAKAELSDQFEALIVALAQQKTFRELREV